MTAVPVAAAKLIGAWVVVNLILVCLVMAAWEVVKYRRSREQLRRLQASVDEAAERVEQAAGALDRRCQAEIVALMVLTQTERRYRHLPRRAAEREIQSILSQEDDP